MGFLNNRITNGGGEDGSTGARGAQGVSVSNITSVDNNDGTVDLTFHLSDGSTIGPITNSLVSDSLIALDKIELSGTDDINKMVVKDNLGNIIFNVNTVTGSVTLPNMDASDGVKLGFEAGFVNQGDKAIAIGYTAGRNNQALHNVNIGYESGLNNTNMEGAEYSVSVGSGSGRDGQGDLCVAVGADSGKTNQLMTATSIGASSGTTNQGYESTAVGYSSGNSNQSSFSTAVGGQSAMITQGYRSTAIGYKSGSNNQGFGCVAIGYGAGHTNQHDNTIVINARGNDGAVESNVNMLNTTKADSFFVDPIAPETGNKQILTYDTTTKEVGYSTVTSDAVGTSVADTILPATDGFVEANSIVIANATRDISNLRNLSVDNVNVTGVINLIGAVDGDILYVDNATLVRLPRPTVNGSILSYNTATSAPQWNQTSPVRGCVNYQGGYIGHVTNLSTTYAVYDLVVMTFSLTNTSGDFALDADTSKLSIKYTGSRTFGCLITYNVDMFDHSTSEAEFTYLALHINGIFQSQSRTVTYSYPGTSVHTGSSCAHMLNANDVIDVRIASSSGTPNIRLIGGSISVVGLS